MRARTYRSRTEKQTEPEENSSGKSRDQSGLRRDASLADPEAVLRNPKSVFGDFYPKKCRHVIMHIQLTHVERREGSRTSILGSSTKELSRLEFEAGNGAISGAKLPAAASATVS
jgi:hypothetical protein